MKHIILFVVCSFNYLNLIAQVPQKMSYQAVLRNTNNTVISNQNVGMQISIIQGSNSGTALYIETHTVSTNINGLVTLEIGGGTMVYGNFSTINWANGPYFIKTETDPNGGNNYTINSVTQLLSVPYALYAESSGSSVPGPQGPPGENTLVKSTLISPGINCINGGFKLEYGLDSNLNGILDSNEVNTSLTNYLCHGIDGSTGPQGPAGFLSNGTAAGNTPFWNGNSWITNSGNLFNNGGNIGIGTSNPQSQLHLSSGFAQLELENTLSGSHLYLTAPGNGTSGGIGTTSSHDLVFFTNGQDHSVLKSSGNFGIGTNDPSAKFEVQSSDTKTAFFKGFGSGIFSGYQSGVSISSYYPTIGFNKYNDGNHKSFSEGYSFDINIDPPVGKIYFNTFNYAPASNSIISPTTRLVIDNNGNIGIGTNNPSSKLEIAGQIKITGGTPGDGKVLTSDASGLASWQDAIAGIPTGTILPFAGANPPAGFVLCDGSLLNRSDYQELFNVIGTNYGSGDNVSTFNIPDLRGLFLRGVDGTAGKDPDKNNRIAMNPGGNFGNNVGSIQGYQIQAHNHSQKCEFGQSSVNVGVPGNYNQVSNTGGGYTTNGSIQFQGGNETRPINAYVNFIIKL